MVLQVFSLVILSPSGEHFTQTFESLSIGVANVFETLYLCSSLKRKSDRAIVNRSDLLFKLRGYL